MSLAELNSATLYNMCCAIRDRTPLVYPKGKTWGRKTDPCEGFFADANTRLRYDQLPKDWMNGRKFRPDSDVLKAWRWFNAHTDEILDGYLRKAWGNDIRKAMETTGSYNALHQHWLDYFSERKEQFMSDTKQLIAQTNTDMAKKIKTPQSHGGVANLLKVLTKTMKEQGSGIENIAKMQYAICTQAGIYIIPEFLTDVLVAEGIIE